jgi:hypothetical protein
MLVRFFKGSDSAKGSGKKWVGAKASCTKSKDYPETLLFKI